MSDETGNENEAATEDGLALLAGSGEALSAEALDQYTVKELRNIAAARKINLKGRDKKGDIIDTMVEATAEGAGEVDSDDAYAALEVLVAEEITEENVFEAVALVVKVLGSWNGVLSDIMKRHSDEVERLDNINVDQAMQIADLKGQNKRLAKKLKTSVSDDTLHGNIDDL